MARRTAPIAALATASLLLFAALIRQSPKHGDVELLISTRHQNVDDKLASVARSSMQEVSNTLVSHAKLFIYCGEKKYCFCRLILQIQMLSVGRLCLKHCLQADPLVCLRIVLLVSSDHLA
jgi:hypothetical protein